MTEINRHCWRVRFARIILVVGFALATSGCYSLRPWFDEAARVFDPTLLGTWRQEGGEEATFVILRDRGRTYWIRSQPDDEGSHLHAVLGQIEGLYYLDTRPDQPLGDGADDWQAAVHMISRIEVQGNKLILRALDPDQIETFLQAADSTSDPELEGIKVPGEGKYSPLLLVSQTNTLKDFLARRGANDSLWDQPIVYRRNSR